MSDERIVHFWNETYSGSGTGGAYDCLGDAEANQCERFPEADKGCVKYGQPPLGYGCLAARTVPVGCVYDYGPPYDPPCWNCLNWCCPPPEAWDG
ncbi:MAG: hypothetical protein HY744_29345, partial [Deltaproteobacteria bacterium]|nr:hypothetical protein [Deltaproteobacteria bacterium]